MIIIAVVSLGVYLFKTLSPSVSIEKISEEEINNLPNNETEKSFVDLSGQVKRPGVYEIKRGMKIIDVVADAGGFTDEINQDYIHKCLNLSQKLVDQQKIYLPAKTEELPCGSVSVPSVRADSSKININTGTLEEIKSLPKVGDVLAQRIIDSRPFKSINDLQNVSGIGDVLFKEIQDSVTL